jgi:Xaa-Pro aminopeptidase
VTHPTDDPTHMRRTTLFVPIATLILPIALSAQPYDAPVLYDADFLSADFHRDRREAVMDALPDDALAVIFGAPTRTRSNDVDYEYRQSSDFLYLTGSHEPGSALLLAPGGVDVDGRTVRELLFVPPRDPAQEVWLGRRFGTERAMEQLGVQLAVEATRFSEIVGPLLEGGEHKVFHLPLPDGVPRGSELGAQLTTFLEHVEPLVVTETGLDGLVLSAMLSVTTPAAYAQVKDISRRGFEPARVSHPVLRAAATAFVSSETFTDWLAEREEILAGHPDGATLRVTLDGLRAVKTDEELGLLRRAIDITVDAHRAVMDQVEPGWAEYEIEALVEYTFRREGAEYPGFPSIVGSGENSVILHYETNRRTTEPGDVVVIDIGAEYHGYSADITRTLPVDGTFSPEQRAVYELVLRAQQVGIDVARSGNSFGAPHFEASRVLADGLARLGLITDPSDRAGLGRFFMHGTSHYLGLDVHDVGSGGPLQPGTVITVEPGIYIPAAPDIDPKWWNIGVRIEDDVLVTDGDPVVLSASAPRTVDEVEALMRGRPAS